MFKVTFLGRFRFPKIFSLSCLSWAHLEETWYWGGIQLERTKYEHTNCSNITLKNTSPPLIFKWLPLTKKPRLWEIKSTKNKLNFGKFFSLNPREQIMVVGCTRQENIIDREIFKCQQARLQFTLDFVVVLDIYKSVDLSRTFLVGNSAPTIWGRLVSFLCTIVNCTGSEQTGLEWYIARREERNGKGTFMGLWVTSRALP